MMCFRANRRLAISFAHPIIDELHLVSISFLAVVAAKHNVDVVAAARQINVAGGQWLRRALGSTCVLIQIRFLAGAGLIAAFIALETFASIAGSSVCGVGVVVSVVVALLKVVLVLKLKRIARLKWIVLGIVEHIANHRIALRKILMYVLAGYLQILI